LPVLIDSAIIISEMKKIGPPYSHYLSAAEGWLGLGNPAEAKKEMARLPERIQRHPDSLDILWAIAAYEQNWTLALDIARFHVGTAPETLSGWIHQAYSLRRVKDGGLQAAWDALFPAMGKFPKDSLIPYNLACYACQLRQPGKARVLLVRAMALGGREHIKRMALNDSDLKPLWTQIQKL
jgi:hypothetical protein